MVQILGVILLVALLFVGYLYNALVKKRFLVDEGWSGIDVQLKRRSDLLPALLETVKGYAQHEQETLQEIVAARNAAQSDDQTTQGMKKLFALAEAYPDLKADKNFRELQSSLIEIEDGLQYARRYYNGTVRDLNILVLSFPSNLIANLFNFKTREFFEVDYVTERKNPDISF